MALTWCSPLDGPITGLAVWAGGPMTGPALYSVFKRKCLERVIAILQLCIESLSQLSLINPFLQVLKSISQQPKNFLVRKVLEESTRIHQSVWNPGVQTKPEVHQLLIATSIPAGVQQISSRYPVDAVDHNEVEQYGTGFAGEYVGNRMVPNSDRLEKSTSELFWNGIVYVL